MPLFISAILFLGLVSASGQKVPFEDPIARLGRQIETGEVKLDYRPNASGYLISLLHTLGVNVDSQLLVFSKTSFQAPLVSPEKPARSISTTASRWGSCKAARCSS